jgi:pimeloyl-ACP methyl ester carboxylesterase
MESLAPQFRVLAPDLYGSGKSPDWPSDRTICLSDEVAFIAPVFPAHDACSIVGHSHGAAVGLMLALAFPQRVRALALYEPTLFSLIDAETAPPNAADGIRQTVQACGMALDQGHAEEAASYFIDYWMGPTSWENTPVSRRAPISASIVNFGAGVTPCSPNVLQSMYS